MQRLFTLANTHEFNLAYNSSEPVRAVAGMTLAGQVLTALNQAIRSDGKTKLSIQFGTYSSFFSYFGLTGLTERNNFTGMPDYSSSMAWELVTSVSGTGTPSPSEISVRFVFHNGTSIKGSTQLQSFPLFGRSEVEIPWTEFLDSTKMFAITSQQQWCQACGNSTGICATASLRTSNNPPLFGSSSKGLSLGDGGVIGAMVTLGVFMSLMALLILVFNFRFLRKSTLTAIGRDSDASIAPIPSKTTSP